MKRRLFLKNLGYFGAISAVITPGERFLPLEREKPSQESPQPLQDGKFVPTPENDMRYPILGSLSYQGKPVFNFETWKLILERPLVYVIKVGDEYPSRVPRSYASAKVNGKGWIQKPGIPANTWIGELLEIYIINPASGSYSSGSGYISVIDALDYPSDYCNIRFEISGVLNHKL